MTVRCHDNDVALGEDRGLDVEDGTHNLGHCDLRADLSNQSSDRFHLRLAEPGSADTDQTREIGLFHDIVINEHQPTDTKMSELKRHVRSGPAAAHDPDRAVRETMLPVVSPRQDLPCMIVANWRRCASLTNPNAFTNDHQSAELPRFESTPHPPVETIRAEDERADRDRAESSGQ